ncbi:lantibiotic dehydratase [Micromonospora sediminicola]|uniref:lantibiotic dehydratase n=1 Tax=Micromonospora sediminicola TaxID=946078 RepID=UPI0033F1F034
MTAAPHHVALPGGWLVWREAVLRAAGFPAAGLDRLVDPACAEVADAFLDGAADEPALAAALDRALTLASRELRDIAADPLFREAVAWQNPEGRNALDGVLSAPEPRVGQPRRSRLRRREEVVARYWQRYCAKNDTIGFFGPICWVRFDPAGPPAELTVGPGLVRRRITLLEHRAVAALAARLARDATIRRWMPVRLAPHLALADREVLRPAASPVPLSAGEAALVRLCDGRRPAVEIFEALAAGPAPVVRTEDDFTLLVEHLVGRGVVEWGWDPPMRPGAEDWLATAVATVGDDAARTRATAALDRLTAARDAVGVAAGDADKLAVALAALDTVFVELTGEPARHRGGHTYAGRALCYEETVRDLDVRLGQPVLDVLAEPLDLLLRASRWLAAEVTAEYRAALGALYAELVEDLDRPTVPLAELWYAAQPLLFGTGERPVDRAAEAYADRWRALCGLDDLPAGTRRVDLDATTLAPASRAAFPARAAGWSGARVHSPDLHLCADGPEAMAAGEFTAVLGEMHATWATLNNSVFALGHDDPAALHAALHADLGGGRILPLLPDGWPWFTARISSFLSAPDDRQFGFLPARGADADRLLRLAELTVHDVAGELTVVDPDGGRVPLLELLGDFLAECTVHAGKWTAGEHTPRITVGRMVLTRETWRTTVDETGIADAAGEQGRYLAVRAWRRRHGMPERVFVRVGTEIKPCYVDFRSTVYASSLWSMLRAARRAAGGQVPVVVSELLPGPEQAWVPDADGNRYTSELRMQVVDALAARPGTEVGT